MTKEQKLAIARMNRALKALEDAGISLVGMDNNLIYATREAQEKASNLTKDKWDVQHPVAEAYREQLEGSGMLRGSAYLDSGAW